MTKSAVLGTPKYMAPEQARTAEANLSVDLYSVGIILYEMLAGRVPFDGDHPLGILMDHQNKPVPSLGLSVDLRSHVGALPQIAFQCLEKNPRHRYESAGRLLEALQGWTEEPASVLSFGVSPASESGGHRSSQEHQPQRGLSFGVSCYRSSPVHCGFRVRIWSKCDSNDYWKSRTPQNS